MSHMVTKKITKAQAVSILLTAAKRVGIDKVMSEDVIKKEFASDLKTAGAILAYIPLPNGVKLAQQKRGCVSTYIVSGPSAAAIDQAIGV